ncbi:MAG: acetyl-CoA carboxylase biotin carboxyl carrier protein subunit [Candidatus Thermoplasmatota archaeon]
MFINYEYENYVYNVIVERRNNEFYITYDNIEYTLTAVEQKPGQLELHLGDRHIKCVISQGEDEKYVFLDGNVYKVRRVELTGRKKTEKKEGDLNSPISGIVVQVKVPEGAIVKKDEVILVIEAMKMEYLIRAPYAGRIKKLFFKEKDKIEIGQKTADIEKLEGE